MDGCEVIGERIKDLREAKGMTQKDVAEELGISRESVNQWERGGRDLKTAQICAIAKLFDVSADYILGLSPNTTTDMNIKSICKATGLPGAVIEQLCRGQRLGEQVYHNFFRDMFCMFNLSGEDFCLLYKEAEQRIAMVMELREMFYNEKNTKSLTEWIDENIGRSAFDTKSIDETTVQRAVNSYKAVCEFLLDEIYSRRYRLFRYLNENVCTTRFAEKFRDDLDGLQIDLLTYHPAKEDSEHS